MPRKKSSEQRCVKRLKITLEQKREIIKSHKQGVSVATLARKYNRTTSTICTILKNKEKISESDASVGVTRMSTHRMNVLDDVERLLLIWINEKQLQGEAITERIICEKAKTIFNDLVEKTPGASSSEKVFRASRGWFEKFKRRIGVGSFVKPGEKAQCDPKAANNFIKDFKQCLDNYLPQQVFCCNEMGLLWKKMPKRMHIMEEEENLLFDSEPIEDRLALLLCANASGDFKIKPLLVYHSETPNAFKKCNVKKNKLNVMWKCNSKHGVTRKLFIDWINQVFGPSVKKYLLDMNLPLQVLLVMNSTPVYLPDLQGDLFQEFKFIKSQYLPANLCRLLQPMDRHVMSDFIKLYTKALFERCYEVTRETNLTVKEFWKVHFHIVTGLKLIEKAWKQITKRSLTSGWRKLWPESAVECVFEEFEAEPAEPVVEETFLLAKKMGLDVSYCDIEELVQEHKPELTTEELMELHRISREEAARESSPSEGRVAREKHISSSSIKEMLSMWDTVASFIKKNHPVKSVALHAINAFVDSAVSPFHQILLRRQKQITEQFFYKTNGFVQSVRREEDD